MGRSENRHCERADSGVNVESGASGFCRFGVAAKARGSEAIQGRRWSGRMDCFGAKLLASLAIYRNSEIAMTAH